MVNFYNETPDADDKFEYLRQWEIECGNKEWEEACRRDDLAWEEACRRDEQAWQNGQDELIQQITESRDRASAKIQAEKKLKPQPELEPLNSQVKGAIPQLFCNYSATDLICNLDNEYLALGGEENSRTVEIINKLSYNQQLRKEVDREIDETGLGDIPELPQSHIPFTSLNSKVLSVEVTSSTGKLDGLYLSIRLLDDINNEFFWYTPILKAVKVDSKTYYDLQYSDDDVYDNCIQPGDSLVLVGSLDRSQETPVLMEEVLSILIPQ